MHVSPLISIFWLGIASNLDNGGVGVAYGVRKISITWFPNFIIAVISLVGTLVAGLFGDIIAHWIPPIVDNLIGGIVIICVGLGVLFQPFFSRRTRGAKGSKLAQTIRNPEEADFNRNNHISFFESVILGIALSMNALAGGFDAGITKLNVLYTSLSVGVFSFILLWLGTFLGSKLSTKHLGDYATIVAGILLILVGVHQF